MLNGETRRRTEVAGICPNDCAIICLVGVILREQNNELAFQRARYLAQKAVCQQSDDPLVSLPAVASGSSRPTPEKLGDYRRQLCNGMGYDHKVFGVDRSKGAL